MKRSKLILPLAAATIAMGSLRGPEVLSAQVLRCWDVVCAVDDKGNMHCIETPRPCPNET